MSTELAPDVETQAAVLQGEADALLQESELLPRLSKYGAVVVTGSYRYRLMTCADLDLHVVNPQAGREQAKALLCELVDQAFWRGFMLQDWVQFHHEDLPTGLYFGLKRDYRDRFWKVDIWLLTESAPEQAAFHEAMSRLTPEPRKAILLLKQWRDQHSRNTPSMKIYEAVLSGQAYDVESFLRLPQED